MTRGQNSRNQRKCREDAEHRRAEPAAHQRSRGYEHVAHGSSPDAPKFAPSFEQMAIVAPRLLAHGVLRFHDHWTERRAMRVVDARVIHRNPEEPRGSKGLHFGIEFFQMPTDRLFAL